MKLYFVVNHSPEYVTKWLKAEASNIKMPSKRCDGIVLLQGYSTNKQTLDVMINSKAKVIVFDGPITAMSIKANLLDIARTASPPHYGIEFTKLNSSVWRNGFDHSIDYTYVKHDYQSAIIKTIESKSLLNSLMTAIYSLPTSSQKAVKVALVNWLFYDGRQKNLNTLLTNLSEKVRMSRSSIDQLMSIMESDLAHVYYEALHKKGDCDNIADEYQISGYDMRYMQQVKGTRHDYMSLLGKLKR